MHLPCSVLDNPIPVPKHSCISFSGSRASSRMMRLSYFLVAVHKHLPTMLGQTPNRIGRDHFFPKSPPPNLSDIRRYPCITGFSHIGLQLSGAVQVVLASYSECLSSQQQLTGRTHEVCFFIRHHPNRRFTNCGVRTLPIILTISIGRKKMEGSPPPLPVSVIKTRKPFC